MRFFFQKKNDLFYALHSNNIDGMLSKTMALHQSFVCITPPFELKENKHQGGHGQVKFTKHWIN